MSKPTDQQIIDKIATEVMGWKKHPEGTWTQIDNEGLEIGTGHRWKDGFSLCPIFRPLRDHNHMAFPRAKMRERGWAVSYKHTGDKNHNHIWLYYKVGYGECRGLIIAEGCGSNKDELRAEAEAILDAIRKDAK